MVPCKNTKQLPSSNVSVLDAVFILTHSCLKPVVDIDFNVPEDTATVISSPI